MGHGFHMSITYFFTSRNSGFCHQLIIVTGVSLLVTIALRERNHFALQDATEVL
jgi:hypothetical protein